MNLLLIHNPSLSSEVDHSPLLDDLWLSSVPFVALGALLESPVSVRLLLSLPSET